MKGRRRAGAVAGMAFACLTLAALAAGTTLVANSEAAKPAPPTNCLSGSKNGKIKHVIYLQFDNVHWRRDNPNVPSDLEQMPHLLDFLTKNGTFNTNDHTVLISHTGGGILSTLTGLYPDRHGQAVSNSYGYFTPAPGSASRPRSSTGPISRTGATRRTTRRRRRLTRTTTWSTTTRASLGGTGATRNAPAPWVPFTRAGCDVGNVGVANTVLENNTAIILRNPGATTFAAAAPAGSTNVKVASVTGLSAGQNVVLESGTATSELATIASVGTAGSGGTGVNLTAPTAKAHALNGAFTVYATDPTGDMTRVFGEGSPEWVEGRNSQIAQSGTAARTLAQTDFVGYAIHCTNAAGSICAGNTNAKPDPLPDEAGGYSGYKALFGAKYVNPAITGGSPSVNGINGNPITDQFSQPGFPGFDGMFAEEHAGRGRPDAGARRSP